MMCMRPRSNRLTKSRGAKESKKSVSLSSRPRGWTGPAILVFAAVLAASPLFLRGPSCSSDFAFHYISWIDAARSMSMGILYPHWANSPNFGAGEPKFVFYPPLTWMGGAVLGMVLPWTWVPLVFSILLLAATGIANRALARMALNDGAATLAGCAAIFLSYALFSIYKRNDFGELAGGFWIPLLLLFALRRRNASGHFWERTFDGSATPLTLVVAGIWLTNGPVGIMAGYLLVAVVLVSALIERSAVPIVRALVSSSVGMGLASIYLLPAVWERNWVSIQNALKPAQYQIENNWLFGLDADPRVASNDPQLLGASMVAVAMLLIAFGGGTVAWLRDVVPEKRTWWLPLALIPPAVLLMLFPVSLPVWNTLPELRLLQWPWRWLVVLEAPMAICFASAVWTDGKTLRKLVIAGCAALFVGISLAAPQWWFVACGTLIDSLQESVRENIGVIGKPEYAPPGTRFPLVTFQLDSQGNVVTDAQGNPIPQVVPDACLLDNPPTASVQGEGGVAPAWRGDPATCKSSGWQELGLLSSPSAVEAPRSLPERKWFMGIAEHAGYAILRLRYFPAWAITVNGLPVKGLADGERGLMAVAVPKGNVRIAVEWSTTGDVVAGRWVSGIALLLVVGLFSFERTRWRALNPSGPDSPVSTSLVSTRESKSPKSESKPSAGSMRTDRGNAFSGKPSKNVRPQKGRGPKR